MPKSFSENEKKLIQERLLEQGARLFGTYGLKKTNIEDLAKAAGISKGAFYLFYPSKEDLFMDVTERTEEQFREEILSIIDQPGPSPRSRLTVVFQKSFSLLETIPILQIFSNTDFELLSQRIQPGKLQQHMANDQIFFERMVDRCAQAGIPIQISPAEISNLLYPLVIACFQEKYLTEMKIADSLALHLELVAAYCLGEIKKEGTE
jgi:AcrR family transcriptional regulator